MKSPESDRRFSIITPLIVLIVLVLGASTWWILYQVNRPTVLELRLEESSPVSTAVQLFFNTGSGYNEHESDTQIFPPAIVGDFKELTFELPSKYVSTLRLDPITASGTVKIRNIEIYPVGSAVKERIPVENITGLNQIARIDVRNGVATVATTPGANDPQISIRLPQPISPDEFSEQDRWLPIAVGEICLLFIAGLVFAIWRNRPKEIANDKVRWPLIVLIVAGLSATAYLWIFIHVPLSLLPVGAHDDGMFITHAYSIAVGDWLGPFNQLTLLKGPGFSIFLAAGALLGIPPGVGEAILNLFAAGLIAYITRRMFGSVLLSLVTFELLLWNFAPDPFRLLREAISTPQLLILVGLLLLSLLYTTGKRAHLAGLLGGITMGWFMVTREESAVIYPALAFITVVVLYKNRKTAQHVWTTAKRLCFFGAGASTVVLTICSINYSKYGAFEIQDMTGDFAKLVSTLESVKSDSNPPFVFVPKDARQKIYKISPTFAGLKPYLDDPKSWVNGWKVAGCTLYGAKCDDYGGAWFWWALRDAMALDGAYKSPAATSAFCRRVISEVDRACRLGRVTCRTILVPLVSRLRPDQLPRIPSLAERAVKTLTFANPPLLPTPMPSAGTPEQISEATRFFNLNDYLRTGRIDDYALPAQIALRTRIFAIHLYQKLMPYLFLLGVLAWFAVAARSLAKREIGIPFAVATCFWMIAICRVALLIFLDITAMPIYGNEGSPMAVQYTSYAFQCVSYASILMIAACFFWLRTARREYIEKHFPTKVPTFRLP
ncbi:MAG TPA: hypothetical protein VN633_01740 [Bryobacteraceae bacterium]|nr:hypothetical protein [Bryobacteraceae bacterium]